MIVIAWHLSTPQRTQSLAFSVCRNRIMPVIRCLTDDVVSICRNLQVETASTSTALLASAVAEYAPRQSSPLDNVLRAAVVFK